MVMHARKPQRISDGYFDKHQTHPYQNAKYGSSKSSGYGTSGERYERMRESPNGNSYRSDSPDSQSPHDRDRSYQSKSSYLQKIREKERENRDYKSSRDKYSDCVRSPKEKRSRENRDSEHRTNHDRSADDKMILHSLKLVSQNSSRDRKPNHNCQEKREDRDRITRVGDWSEHISSSGKKYYYNCKTEVSQWEKPREWVERERERERERSSRNRDRDRDLDRTSYSSSSSSRAVHEKHSNARSSNSSRSEMVSRGNEIGPGGLKSVRQWVNTKDDSVESVGSTMTRSSETQHQSEASRRRMANENTAADSQDMDISPGDSTPTSETSRDQPSDQHTVVTGPVLLATALPRLTTTPPQASAPPMVPPPASVAPPGHAPGPPPVSLAASLPRLLSQMASTSVKQLGSGSSASTDCTQVEQQQQQTLMHTGMMLSTPPVSSASQLQQPLKVDTAAHVASEGPPTPTHSEGQDCMDSRKLNSPPSSLSSLGALRPQGPSLTPSLANHYRDDLVNHVRGWPAEILEKQAQKLIEEAHYSGSIQCAKVSADLKIARSLVRLTEIQATLQEQRILFLRQQIKTLEDMKSQNSFMSDDS